ncbi:uncharacterized protein LOC122316623 [Carya illinoinensis]|uniref:uncharacterized protein LOC122316623 n=1 Tax=Carya illinoinensis TaxID=32201 RepID=UPI001C720BD3|nr:uncharacterized protein LOC122316623 [Carya illinoinensis]
MARILAQSLLRRSPFRSAPFRALSVTCSLAHRSFSSGQAQLIEIDQDPTSSGSSSSSSSSFSDDDGEFGALAMKKLDDLIHRIIVQKSTPDWLPFVPGSSFWVPPRPGTSKVLDLVGKLADQLNQEESLSLISSRGWPCSSFFLDGNVAADSIEVDLEDKGSAEVEEVKVKVLKNSAGKRGSEDEEG